MSAVASTWAWKQNQIDPAAKFILVALADIANAKHRFEVWASVETICKRTGYSERTVRDRLDDLEETGLIRFVRWFSKGSTKVYRLLVDTVKAAVDATQRVLEMGADSAGEGVQILHPNLIPDNSNKKERERAREDLPKAKKADEHISHSGFTFTVTQWERLQRVRGEALPAVIADLAAYRDSGGVIRSAYGAALTWTVFVERPITPHERERKRETVAPVENPEVDIFDHYVCHHCDVPHQWREVDTEYAYFSAKIRPCPKVRGMKVMEVI